MKSNLAKTCKITQYNTFLSVFMKMFLQAKEAKPSRKLNNYSAKEAV